MKRRGRIQWVSCKAELPPARVKLLIWCAQSLFWEGEAIEAQRVRGKWIPADDAERFSRFADPAADWQDSGAPGQDPNIFVTHWCLLEPPRDVPSVDEMREALKEDDV